MIDRVVVCGARRANKYVPEIEIRQMIGRCGRSYDNSSVGRAIMMVQEQDSKFAEKCLFGELPSIDSNMSKVDEIAFHILPHIYSRDIDDRDSAFHWYERSLAHFQGKPFVYDELIDFLKMLKMISFDGDKFRITELGKVSCKFYYRPLKISTWKYKFELISKRDCLEDDWAVAWALATEKVNLYPNQELMEVFESGCMASGFSFDNDEKTDGLIFYCLLQGYKPKEMKFAINECMEDMDRMTNALLYLDRFYNWEMTDFLNILNLRIKRKLPLEAAKFMYESKIYNKAILFRLMELGCNSSQDVLENKEMICKYGDKMLWQQAKEFIDAK